MLGPFEIVDRHWYTPFMKPVHTWIFQPCQISALKGIHLSQSEDPDIYNHNQSHIYIYIILIVIYSILYVHICHHYFTLDPWNSSIVDCGMALKSVPTTRTEDHGPDGVPSTKICYSSRGGRGEAEALIDGVHGAIPGRWFTVHGGPLHFSESCDRWVFSLIRARG